MHSIKKDKVKDIVGRLFGNLEVLAYLGKTKNNKRSKTFWLCKCVCGKEREYAKETLLGGNVSSCGCRQNIKPRRFLPEQYAKNQVLSQYKNSAKRNNRDWLLARDFFFEMIAKPCSYCGRDKTNLFKNNRGSVNYTGLDRLDNTIGYVKDNVVPCCIICNRAKRGISSMDFRKYLEDLTAFQLAKETPCP